MAVSAVNAAMVYVPVWSQDFEDAATYANELWVGRLTSSLLGTAAALPHPLSSAADYEVLGESWDTSQDPSASYNCRISPEARIRQENGAAAAASTYMRALKDRNGNSSIGKDTDLMFILPDDVAEELCEVDEYTLEFDYYLGASFENGSGKYSKNTATNGLVVATGEGEALAILCTPPNGSSAAAIGRLYTADYAGAQVASGILVGPRGSYDASGLWLHFSFCASDLGVTMSVTQERGATIIDNMLIRDSFAVIDRLYIHAHAEAYRVGACLDNVSVTKGVEIPEGPRNCTWTNSSGDSRWSNPANWEIAGASGVAAPGAADTAVFPAGGAQWNVWLDSSATVANFVANGAVSLAGGGALTCSSFMGGGKFTLSGVTLCANGADISIGSELEIAADTTNFIKLAVDRQYFDCHLFGALSGAGYLDVQISESGGADKGMKFHGDNSAFAGTFASSVSYARNGTAFDSAASSSANAVWLFNNTSPRSNMESALFSSSADTYRFGAFQGRMKSGDARRKVEFGGRGDVQTIVTLSNRHNSSGARRGGFDVTKVGYGAATFLTATENGSPDSDAIESLDIQGGAILLGSPAQIQTLSFSGDGGILGIAGNVALDPSPFIKNSSAPICFLNIEGESHAWATPLDASNTAGLLKLGEGTLTLAAPPLYGGETVVAGGRLVVSNATSTALRPGPGTCIEYDGFGTATLTPSPPDAVAMSGTVPYGDFHDALAACLANPEQPLTLLADALDIPLPLGASIRLRPNGYDYSFVIADRCRIDVSDQGGGIFLCSHAWDVVAVEQPLVPNAVLVSATTNGVALALSNGRYNVLRGERVYFSWEPRQRYTLNAFAVSIGANNDINSIPQECLPFAMNNVEIAAGRILRLMDVEGETSREFTPPATLETLSVESIETQFTMRLDSTLSVSNIVFTAGLELAIAPGEAFGDGDTLIAWLAPHSIDGFVLSPDAVAAGWTLRAEQDGLKLYLATRCSVRGFIHSSLEDAFAASSDGDVIRLEQDSWLFERIDLPSGESRTLDLAGHTLKAAPVWAVNIGDATLAVSNGTILCNRYGFYVNDGSLAVSDCRIEAEGRVVQIRGTGAVEIAPTATLATMGDDPVIFAIGSVGGRANVVSRGAILQLRSGATDATASCIAGNSDDTFGADFSLHSDSAVCANASAAECIHHPFFQGGGVEISDGWFASMPHPDWIVPGRSIRSETLSTLAGYRVFQPMPQASDEFAVAAILRQAADANNLAANIVTTGDYDDYREWVAQHSSFPSMNASRFAWTAFALDAPALIQRTAPLAADDMEISAFSAPDSSGNFSIAVGLKDCDIGDAADINRLLAVFDLAGSSTLTFSADDLPDDCKIHGELENGKLRFVASPLTPPPSPFFFRVNFLPSQK